MNHFITLGVTLLLLFSLSGCAAFQLSEAAECRKLCLTERVETFKFEVLECTCAIPKK